ncbi:hypothetical protein EXS70_03970 [Candidatus Peribacteria bacterium]|nr:hypothetical protein [Candidatus Peribacteria bacterium]
MRLLTTITGLLIPRASAAIEQLGSGGPGIVDMWGSLKQLFPHTDFGSGGLGFILLLASNIILRMIGGVAVLMIVYGGIRMIMNVYDEAAHTEAKKIVISACVGLVLVITADAIVLYVISVVQMASGG